MKHAPERLWASSAPGPLGDSPLDVPTLTAFVPEHPNGAAMVICPGGGYSVVVDHERDPVAEYLNSLGITAFVLVYRCAERGRYPAPLVDLKRAIRSVRAQADRWKIDRNRVGVIGFSAGGHLASLLAVHHDEGDAAASDALERESSRPDLAVLVYPVISMLPGTWKGKNLMGPEPSEALMHEVSTHLHVKAETPATFIYHRRLDGTVAVQHPMLFATAMANAGAEFELHIYDHKGHGQVWAKDDPVDGDWPERLKVWLKGKGF